MLNFLLQYQLLHHVLVSFKVVFILFSQISDARGLFRKLEEKCLLENSSFLSQLLRTIRRADLLNLLEADSRQLEETDARPLLSEYR